MRPYDPFSRPPEEPASGIAYGVVFVVIATILAAGAGLLLWMVGVLMLWITV